VDENIFIREGVKQNKKSGKMPLFLFYYTPSPVVLLILIGGFN
jgi:hypothetical protein